MSMTQKKFDKAYCQDQVIQSTKPFDLLMDPIVYEHPNACRIDLGIVSGNNVSTVGNTRESNNGELIDVDSMLRGLDRYNQHNIPAQLKNELNPGKTTDLKECSFSAKPYNPHIN